MNNIKIINMITSFPVGQHAKTRIELLSKAEIIAYLSKFQHQFSAIDDIDDIEEIVRSFLMDIIGLKSEEILPDLGTAERVLNLSPGFLYDYGKIQLIKENNMEFDRTFDVIANSIELVNTHSKLR